MVNEIASAKLHVDGPSESRLHAVGQNVLSGVLVALVAAPLCVGISAIDSNVPAWAGIISGVIGGVLVGVLSKSRFAVTGPTAGLVAVVAVELATLGSFETFLLSVVVAGVLQITFGLFRLGSVAAFIPTTVIRGFLCAVGIILVLKQIPHVLGHDTDPEGEMSFLQPDRENTFSELGQLVADIHPGAAAIGLTSLLILLAWERLRLQSRLWIPGPLFVVLFGIVVSEIFQRLGGWWLIQPNHLVQLPLWDSNLPNWGALHFPNFSQWSNITVYQVGFSIAVVASLESLLSLAAVDRLDPEKKKTSFDRELLAQGAGNLSCGLLGGLPLTVEVVRSAVNLEAGARTRLSAIVQGLALMVFVVLYPRWISQIPLSCLAAILLFTGAKLCRPSIFREMWAGGRYQFLPFIAMILAVIFSDLLVGTVIGLLASLSFILNSNLRRPLKRVIEKHLGGDVLVIELANQVSFLNRAVLERTLYDAKAGAHILLDARGTDYIDSDILTLIHEFRTVVAPAKGVHVSLRGFRHKYQLNDEIQYVDYSTRDIQQNLTPLQVLQVLIEGNARFRTGKHLTRDLGRQLNATAQGQHPLAVVLSCIDSRTPIELILDLGLGDVFSVRVAGNVISPKVLGSIEYGCLVAGAKILLVMGHTRCGAVGAAVSLTGSSQTVEEATGCQNLGPIIQDIQSHMTPESLVNLSGLKEVERQEVVDKVAGQNVRKVVAEIQIQSTTLSCMLDAQKIALVGCMYDVATGTIQFLDDAIVGLSKDDLQRLIAENVW